MSSSLPPNSLPLTKFLHRSDLEALAPELLVVESFGMPNGHELRAWEYAMCLRALNTWGAQLEPAVPHSMVSAIDVGGHGSPLAQMLLRCGLNSVLVVDPSQEVSPARIQDYQGPPAAVVTCVSTIEHIPDSEVLQFVDALARVTKRGGLLFLTADAQEDPAPHWSYPKDEKHFNWMRARIFSPRSWGQFATMMESFGFSLLGDTDWEYRGPHVYDYTFASMALVKSR